MDSNWRGKSGSVKLSTGYVSLDVRWIRCPYMEAALRVCLRLALVTSSIAVSAGMTASDKIEAIDLPGRPMISKARRH